MVATPQQESLQCPTNLLWLRCLGLRQEQVFPRHQECGEHLRAPAWRFRSDAAHSSPYIWQQPIRIREVNRQSILATVEGSYVRVDTQSQLLTHQQMVVALQPVRTS